MPKLVFTQAEVNTYLKGYGFHCYRDVTIRSANDMLVHADGIFPELLLRERRPNEPLEVLKYRQLIYKAITKSTFSKVYSSLQKIRRSRDWSIKYTDQEDFSRINPEETLEKYCEKNFPYFTSLTNWIFSIVLRKYLIDANAVVFVVPVERDIDENGYLEPFPEIFDSCYVVDFREEDFAVLESPTPVQYTTKEGGTANGKRYYFVTTQNIFRYDQTDGEQTYTLTDNYVHGLGFLPAFKLGGLLVNQADRKFLFETRISAMLPELDEAVREYSDLQAAKVLHIYPERWEYTSNECTTCKGSGKRPNPHFAENNGEPIGDPFIDCKRCEGQGYLVAGPYSKIMVKPADAMNPGASIPTPPAGYIQKDIAVVDSQQAGVDAHLYKALSAINFEFLSQTPLNQSGTAKEVDKDELNNTVNSIAEDLVAIMDKCYKIIAYYRYGGLYSLDDIDEMLPDIPVPQEFDLLGTQTLETELINARKNNMNPVILNAIEIDYATKRFNDQSIRDMVALTLDLDPLPNVAEADKILMLSNQGITLVTYVITSNISTFIHAAIDADPNFVNFDESKQKNIIQQMAEAQILAASNAQTIIRSAFMQNGGNGAPQNKKQAGDLTTTEEDDTNDEYGNTDLPNNNQNNIAGVNGLPTNDPVFAAQLIG